MGTTLLVGPGPGLAVTHPGGTGEVVAISATVVGALRLAVPDAAMVSLGPEDVDSASASHAGTANRDVESIS